MTSQTKVRIATGFVFAAAGLVVLWREGKIDVQSTPAAVNKADSQPHDALYRTLDAVRDGDLKAYLDSHTGPVAESMRKAIAEMGESKFMEALQRQNRPLKGVAVNEPERLSDVQAKARVEYVFADRNETQTVFFEKVSGQWRISRVDGAERIRTAIPYGTPVNDVR